MQLNDRLLFLVAAVVIVVILVAGLVVIIDNFDPAPIRPAVATMQIPSLLG